MRESQLISHQDSMPSSQYCNFLHNLITMAGIVNPIPQMFNLFCFQANQSQDNVHFHHPILLYVPQAALCQRVHYNAWCLWKIICQWRIMDFTLKSITALKWRREGVSWEQNNISHGGSATAREQWWWWLKWWCCIFFWWSSSPWFSKLRFSKQY